MVDTFTVWNLYANVPTIMGQIVKYKSANTFFILIYNSLWWEQNTKTLALSPSLCSIYIYIYIYTHTHTHTTKANIFTKNKKIIFTLLPRPPCVKKCSAYDTVPLEWQQPQSCFRFKKINQKKRLIYKALFSLVQGLNYRTPSENWTHLQWPASSVSYQHFHGHLK